MLSSKTTILKIYSIHNSSIYFSISFIDENILVNGLNNGISYVISDINTFNDSNNVH